MTIALLVLAMIFNIGAQYLLKNGVSGIRFDGFSANVLIKIFSSPYIWTGAVSYGMSFLFYILAISRGELSRISPVSQALTTLGVVAMSVIFFQESLSLYKIIGVGFLLVGTIIIFK